MATLCLRRRSWRVSLQRENLPLATPRRSTPTALLELANRVVVVVNHTELGHMTFVQIAPMWRASTFIMNADRYHVVLEERRRRGLNVITV